jgi:hypothetical protein
MRAAIEDMQFMSNLMEKPLTTSRTFLKTIHDVKNKTKKQVENSLNLEVETILRQNKDLEFKNAEVTKGEFGSVVYSLHFEKFI